MVLARVCKATVIHARRITEYPARMVVADLMTRTSALARIVFLGATATWGLACAPAGALPAAKPPTTASPARAPAPEVALPASPAGEAATAWLHAVNESSRDEMLSFFRTRYVKALLDEWPAEGRRNQLHDMRVMDGRRRVRAIESASDTEIVAILEADGSEERERLVIGVDPKPPYMIVKDDLRDAPPGGPLPETDREAKEAFDGYVTRLCDRGLFSGAVKVVRSGTLLYEHACGIASRAWGIPNRLDTKFNLGSMNKMFTAVSIAQLVDAGKLSYDDTLAKAWPEYPNRAVAEKITIRQLLSHTSGLGDYFTDEYERTSKERLRAIKDYLPLFVDKPLLFEPGTKSRYSNAGFMVLGGVVQRVSGQDYFDYVRAHVYAPAGMKDTDAYELDHDPQNLAIGYTPDRDDPNEPLVPGKLRNNLYMHVVKGGPAGGGFSTVGDLIAFGDALLHGKLLPSAQVATLTTTHGAPEPKSYGYGFALRSIDGQREFGHSGGFPGINSELALFPDSGLYIAAMGNLDPPAAQRVCARAEALFAHVGLPPAARPQRTP
jgi:CubicO group peptidase (beta-lactamase class C family)